MLPFGYKKSKEEEKDKEEEGRKTCRSSDFCSPDSLDPTQEAAIKPSHSTASLTMKKGGFSFTAAGGPTPRDDSARSDRKENALPGCEVPPLSP
ncbi:hypothetical protein NQZ68_017440 [Dissostichus eleginoides]|nr:hypothetical protein NQZ68_017440 [Dissostichus eleginoides]